MWSFGYTDYVSGEDVLEVPWGEASTFTDAMSELLENVEKLASDAESYEESHFEQILAEIRTIDSDPAYREDPDQWEDMEFSDEFGAIVYYVVFVN